MPEQEQTRSEPATPFKLAEARKQGQVAKSADLNSFAIVAVLLAVLLIEGARAATRLGELCGWLFQAAGSVPLEGPGDAVWLSELVMAALQIIIPVGVIGVLCAVIVNLLQTGPVFSAVPLRPKFDRLNPVTGFKRIFSWRMLFEALKTIVKVALFVAVLYTFLTELWPLLSAISSSDAGTQALWFLTQAEALLWRLCAVMLLIGLLDLTYTRWQFGKQMMMSRRELRDEIKRREGDPLIRAKLRELQRENLKQARSLGRVSDADVIITNPEHLAIALKYVPGEMSAPYVLAKGADAWAEKMRQVALKAGIPRYERRALARLLFRRGQLDRPIPPDAFLEVARVYAEVEVRRRRLARYEVRQ